MHNCSDEIPTYTILSLFFRQVLHTMVGQTLILKKFMAKKTLDHFKEFQVSFETLKPLAKPSEFPEEPPTKHIKNKCK